MRVALDYASNWEIRGGVWRYGLELTRALGSIVDPNDIIVPCYDRLTAERLDELRTTGASVHTGAFSYRDVLDGLALRRGRIVPWDTLLPLVYRPWVREYLFRQALNHVDVYHAIFTCRGTPTNGVGVGTIHDAIPLLHPGDSDLTREKFNRMVEEHRRWSELVIVPSVTTKRDLIHHLDFPADRLRVVYHGINTDVFHPEVRVNDEFLGRHRLAQGQFFLYVGALERRKNIDLLVEAYRRSVDHGPSFPLVLAGLKVHSLPKLEEALGDPTSGVRHIGYVAESELPGLYRSAFALVHVALIEGFGFTPLEAMACGTPCIVTRQSATGEVVGDAGLLVDPTDVSVIGGALRTLRSDNQMHTALRRAGQARASTFTWERCARQTHLVYQEAHSRWRQSHCEQGSAVRTRAKSGSIQPRG